MKTSRVVAASFFSAMFLMSSLSADTAVQEPEAPVAAAEEEAPAEEDTNCSCCSPFGGFYVGLGLGWNLMKLKNSVETTENTALLGVAVGEAVKSDASKNANRFVGTIMLGGGKLWDNGFYAGLNFYFDLGQNKKVSKTETPFDKQRSHGDEQLKTEMRTNSWSPALALRLGFVPSSYNTLMVYLDLGAAYNKAEFRHSLLDKEGKVIKANGKELVSGWQSASKVVPLVRVGFQKAFGQKFIAGAEVEYKFRGSKSWGDLNAEDPKEQGKVKFKFAEGFTLRVIGTVNFNLNN